MKKVFNFLTGLIIIFSVQFFCAYILRILKITFPAPILGIILLFLLLKCKIIEPEKIEDCCNFLLKNMVLFFIPLFVGIITYSDIILKNFQTIIATIFITTTLVMVIVGLFVENVIKFKKLNKYRKNKVL